MKKSKILPFILFIILTVSLPNKIFATEYFDTYFGNISWNDERAHLGNLAIELKHDPGMIGYIAFRIGPKDNRKKIRSRIERMKKFLFSNFNLSPSRIVFVISKSPSQMKETVIILQPLSKDILQPDF